MNRSVVYRGSYGRTLIELLVAMAIGLVILAGVASLYLSSSGLSRTSAQISNTEQAGQLAMLMIGEMVKLAGYGEIVGSDFVKEGQTMLDGAHIRGCSNARFVDPFPPYLAPPEEPTPPDLNCGGAAIGDALYIRYQAGPVVAQMTAAESGRILLRDCLAQINNQDEVMAGRFRPGTGLVRPMATSVIQYDSVNQTLDCQGQGSVGFDTLLHDVVDFKVFYRFDRAAFDSGRSGMSHAAPVGGSIMDATQINALPGPIDPWNYVVAVIVCVTMQTNEAGVGQGGAAVAPRCPVNGAEAEAGVNLTGPVTDGRIHRSFTQVFTVRWGATGSPSITL
jgi:type II secretory pathway pseudopilin PulG